MWKVKGVKDFKDVIGYWLAVHELTFSLDTNQYADGDVLAAPQELENVAGLGAGCGVMQSILLLDVDDQGAELDLVFLSADVSLGTENAGVGISDANAAYVVGVVSVGSTDYVDLGGCQVAHKENLGIGFQCAAGETSLWVGAVSRGTGTYTASGIKLKIGVLQGM
jgi:hypothetical protein